MSTDQPKRNTMSIEEERQAKKERIIFQLFVKAAHLAVIPDSIRSEPPPAPDILCEIRGRGPVAFELGEIVTPALLKETADGQQLIKPFQTACKKHSEIAARYHDARIYVGFVRGLTMRKRRELVPEVVDELFKHSENSVRYIPVPRKLKTVLVEIAVTRGVSNGPQFDVQEAAKRTEEIFTQIEKKCKKRYVSNHSIELLAYYISQPSSDRVNWQSKFHDYVFKIFPECPFERIWIYDHRRKSIKYVYPAP